MAKTLTGDQYIDIVKSVIPNLPEQSEGFKKILNDLINGILAETKAYNADKENSLEEYSGTAETILSNILYCATGVIKCIPYQTIVDAPEKWVPIDEDDKFAKLIGMHTQVASDKRITIHKIERHTDTTIDTVAEIIRFNGDSNLACMPYSGVYQAFHNVGDAEPYRQFAAIAFIQEFPFEIQFPVIQEIYEDVNIGIISDLSKENWVAVPNISSRTYTPGGTAIWPAKVPEDAEDIPKKPETPAEESQCHCQDSEEECEYHCQDCEVEPQDDQPDDAEAPKVIPMSKLAPGDYPAK